MRTPLNLQKIAPRESICEPNLTPRYSQHVETAVQTFGCLEQALLHGEDPPAAHKGCHRVQCVYLFIFFNLSIAIVRRHCRGELAHRGDD